MPSQRNSGRLPHRMLIEKLPRLGAVMACRIVQKGVSLIPRPHGRGLLPVFDGCESFRLGQSVGGSLNFIPTSSLPRTIAEFYRYETKDFGRVRSHRLWASRAEWVHHRLGRLKKKGITFQPPTRPWPNANRKVTDDEVLALAKSGLSVPEIAAKVGVGISSVHRRVKRLQERV